MPKGKQRHGSPQTSRRRAGPSGSASTTFGFENLPEGSSDSTAEHVYSHSPISSSTVVKGKPEGKFVELWQGASKVKESLLQALDEVRDSSEKIVPIYINVLQQHNETKKEVNINANAQSNGTVKFGDIQLDAGSNASAGVASQSQGDGGCTNQDRNVLQILLSQAQMLHRQDQELDRLRLELQLYRGIKTHSFPVHHALAINMFGRNMHKLLLYGKRFGCVLNLDAINIFELYKDGHLDRTIEAMQA